MATLTIKNLPDSLYESLKQQAVLHRRSLNSEVIVSLENVLLKYKTDPLAVLKAARTLREKSAKYVLTEKQLRAIKDQGRP
jgi:plasmid stability protein